MHALWFERDHFRPPRRHLDGFKAEAGWNNQFFSLIMGMYFDSLSTSFKVTCVDWRTVDVCLKLGERTLSLQLIQDTHTRTQTQIYNHMVMKRLWLQQSSIIA